MNLASPGDTTNQDATRGTPVTPIEWKGSNFDTIHITTLDDDMRELRMKSSPVEPIASINPPEPVDYVMQKDFSEDVKNPFS